MWNSNLSNAILALLLFFRMMELLLSLCLLISALLLCLMMVPVLCLLLLTAVLLQIYKSSSQQNDANRYHIHSDWFMLLPEWRQQSFYEHNFCQIYKYTWELKQFKMKLEHIIWAQSQGAWSNQQQNMQFTPLLSLSRENTAVKRRAFATVFT